jgi:hypothetical protein
LRKKRYGKKLKNICAGKYGKIAGKYKKNCGEKDMKKIAGKVGCERKSG